MFRVFGYSPADDMWDPRRMLASEVPDVVKEYESSKRSATVIDAVGPTHDLASRDARELLIDDDLPSDSEVYCEAREQ